MKRLKIGLLSIVISLTNLLTMIPNNIFAQGETFLPSEEVVNNEDLGEVETTTPVSLQLRSTENNRSFDVQEIDYRRSSVNSGMKYE